MIELKSERLISERFAINGVYNRAGEQGVPRRHHRGHPRPPLLAMVLVCWVSMVGFIDRGHEYGEAHDYEDQENIG